MAKFEKKAYETFVKNVVKELGNSPDQVASSLRNWQIVGSRHAKCGCPLGTHIATQLALNGFKKVKVYVKSMSVLLFDPDKNEDDGFITGIDLTRPAESFIDKFDRGEYKELVHTK